MVQCGADDDADSLANTIEGDGSVDTDMDGIPDSKDPDSDNDGWPDSAEAGECGKPRTNVCASPQDTDGDGIADFRDLDSDQDGVPDFDEKKYDPDGSKCCRVLPDCDGDGVPDVVEVAAASDPVDMKSVPPDATLYFVLPFMDPEKTKSFPFQTGVKIADIYFMIDTTASMGPTISNIAASLDTAIIPKILNGDPTASPPIPAIPGAYIGMGDFRDVPWAPYGDVGDSVYRNHYNLGGKDVYGNVAPPAGTAPAFTAPDGVKTILASLKAGGGGDGPEGYSQALWMAASGQPYQATLGGLWKSEPPVCDVPTKLGVPCFRPDALPIFVVVTDAPMHAGPDPTNDYGANVGGSVKYSDTVAALNAHGSKIVGVAVDTGTPGAARTDLTDLALKTGSVFHDSSFGAGVDRPLVTPQDTNTGDVSSEVVRLIGRLAGAGLHDVTTAKSNYDCAGNVDCDGDGKSDPAYHNPSVPAGAPPFDASTLITAVVPVPSTMDPLPYASADMSTFYGVRGDATVEFLVHARNTTLNPATLLVLRAVIQVQTPNGQKLGGPAGTKVVYFVIPRNADIIPK
jgi:hypothetical protein